MGKNLVLVGGGHAHLACLLHGGEFVGRGHTLKLISPCEYHYYSGMGPGMLGGTYRPQEIRFNIKKMAEERGISFLKDMVSQVEPAKRLLVLASGEKIPYDIVSFNVGSQVLNLGEEKAEEEVFKVKPISSLFLARQKILSRTGRSPVEILVVGGGAAGLEVAGNLWGLAQRNNRAASITLLAGRSWLGSLPEKARRMVQSSFRARGIKVLEGPRVISLSCKKAFLDNGMQIPYELAFLATGVRPPSIFRASGLRVGADGGLLVDHRLQSVEHPEMFGAGDCISLKGQTLDKVGVYAVRQGRVLLKNLAAALECENMSSFKAQGKYLLILNLGDGRGIYWRGGIIWQGKLAFYLKDWIDRRFVRRFQVSGELEEEETADPELSLARNPAVEPSDRIPSLR